MTQPDNSRATNPGVASKRRVAVLAVSILCGELLGGPGIRAQELPTASRLGDLQVGGSFSFGRSVNSQVIPSTRSTLPGYAVYGTFDNRPHFGIEGSFRQINDGGSSHIYERTYEIGGRVAEHFHRSIFNPYGKLLYGRGVYNYHDNVANLAYNIYTAGVGADVRMSQLVNVRVDYEYQTWLSFPRGTLHPNVLSVGVAYHVPPDCRTFICPVHAGR